MYFAPQPYKLSILHQPIREKKPILCFSWMLPHKLATKQPIRKQEIWWPTFLEKNKRSQLLHTPLQLPLVGFKMCLIYETCWTWGPIIGSHDLNRKQEPRDWEMYCQDIRYGKVQYFLFFPKLHITMTQSNPVLKLGRNYGAQPTLWELLTGTIIMAYQYSITIESQWFYESPAYL